MKKTIIFLIIIFLLDIIFLIEICREYAIGTVISTDGHSAIVSIENSSKNIYTGKHLSIYSNKVLNVGDKIKLRFKYTPFKEDYIYATYPARTSNGYYVSIIQKSEN